MYRIKGKGADFLNESERIAQKDWAISLLTEYEQLDGIHFDYIRYNISSIANQTKINAIASTINLTMSAIQDQFPDKILTTASFGLSGEISNNDDFIPAWYNEWFTDPTYNDINRWNRTGYDFKGIPTPFRVQQDPKSWISKNLLNFTISMEYCYETSWWTGEVDIWNSWLKSNISSVYMGLGYYSKIWEDPLITPQMAASEIVNKIHYGRANNITGFSIFEFGELGNNDYILIDALTIGPNAPFADNTNSDDNGKSRAPIDLSSYLIIISIILAIIFAFIILIYYKKDTKKK